MCKFNNRLFVFALYCLLGLVCVLAKPLQSHRRDGAEDLGALLALSTLLDSQDVHYDQRQKGQENYRIKLDGFFIGVPQEDSTALLLLTDDIFEGLDDDNLLAFGKNRAENLDTGASASASPMTASSTTVISHKTTESKPNLSPNADVTAKNRSPLLVEMPVSKRYLESRHNEDSVSRTKSYLHHFLNLLKRVRKY